MGDTTAKIFARINRGVILDAVVLIVNTLLMTVLSGRLKMLFDARMDKQPEAEVVTFLYVFAITVLPACAGILKFIAGNRFKPIDYEIAGGGIFPPALKILLVGQFILQAIFIFTLFETRQDLLEQSGGNWVVAKLFLTLAMIAIFAVVLYPIFTYSHFFVDTTGWGTSRVRFAAEVAGDLLIFVNVILYQAFWGLLMTDLPNDIHNIAGRIFQFLFSAALIYIPPRIYYLADDGGRWITWVMIVLANLPVLIRILFF